MKYYVRFLDLNTRNEVSEALGSDAVFILDGRNTLENMIVDAIKQFHRMNKNLHSYCGWRIMKGSRFNNSVLVKEWILSGAKTNG